MVLTEPAVGLQREKEMWRQRERPNLEGTWGRRPWTLAPAVQRRQYLYSHVENVAGQL